MPTISGKPGKRKLSCRLSVAGCQFPVLTALHCSPTDIHCTGAASQRMLQMGIHSVTNSINTGRGKSRYTKKGEYSQPVSSSFPGLATGRAELCLVRARQHARAQEEAIFVHDDHTEVEYRA